MVDRIRRGVELDCEICWFERNRSALSWIYNPLAVRPAGLVPFAPLTLRDASIGARVRVSADESVVVVLF